MKGFCSRGDSCVYLHDFDAKALNEQINMLQIDTPKFDANTTTGVYNNSDVIIDPITDRKKNNRSEFPFLETNTDNTDLAQIEQVDDKTTKFHLGQQR